jgi:hypothetical protein
VALIIRIGMEMGKNCKKKEKKKKNCRVVKKDPKYLKRWQRMPCRVEKHRGGHVNPIYCGLFSHEKINQSSESY